MSYRNKSQTGLDVYTVKCLKLKEQQLLVLKEKAGNMVRWSFTGEEF